MENSKRPTTKEVFAMIDAALKFDPRAAEGSEGSTS